MHIQCAVCLCMLCVHRLAERVHYRLFSPEVILLQQLLVCVVCLFQDTCHHVANDEVLWCGVCCLWTTGQVGFSLGANAWGVGGLVSFWQPGIFFRCWWLLHTAEQERRSSPALPSPGFMGLSEPQTL